MEYGIFSGGIGFSYQHAWSRGAYGDGYGVHMGFIGLQTYLQRTIEFHPPSR